MIIYILLAKEIDLKNSFEKSKKFVLIVIFIWSVTNLFLSTTGYTISFFINLNKKNVSSETLQPVREIVANPSQKAILYGKINVLPRQKITDIYVSNAQVVLRDSNNELILDQTYSDEEGKFRIVLNVPQENNMYNLYIYHERYYEYATKVQLIPGIIHELEITLIPK
ncbi:MAG: hypothetical protein SNJ64_00300 [Endomicrobiia bacterium]